MRVPTFSVTERPGDTPPYQITDGSGTVEEGVSAFLRDLIASDHSPATVKTYAFALCAWFNFLQSRGLPWQCATHEELRDYVLLLRSSENPYRARRRAGGPESGGVNPRTGKPYLAAGYKPATINHRLSVIQSFYAFQQHVSSDRTFALSLVDRRNAHHNALEPWPRRRRGMALGDCYRPYRTDCPHEHACVRCPMLRMDVEQLPHLVQIEAVTYRLLDEAKRRGWEGEGTGLETTLVHI